MVHVIAGERVEQPNTGALVRAVALNFFLSVRQNQRKRHKEHVGARSTQTFFSLFIRPVVS